MISLAKLFDRLGREQDRELLCLGKGSAYLAR